MLLHIVWSLRQQEFHLILCSVGLMKDLADILTFCGQLSEEHGKNIWQVDQMSVTSIFPSFHFVLSFLPLFRYATLVMQRTIFGNQKQTLLSERNLDSCGCCVRVLCI